MTTLPCLLVDNGSLRPEATISLRALAGEMSQRLQIDVQPVSLLHSSKIDPSRLNGVPAESFPAALRKRIKQGLRELTVLPLFIGPSRAITQYLPLVVAEQKLSVPELKVHVADTLFRLDHPHDDRIARILHDRLQASMQAHDLTRPACIMVDHGTPAQAVNEVRNRIGQQLETLLGDTVSGFCAASMERREGAEYAFNEPLLEHALEHEGFSSGEVLISMLFLQPGRHAGPDGDVAQICRDAEAQQPELRTHMSELAGGHPLLLEVLEERYRQCHDEAC